jgi:hypothetical protein
MLIGTRLKKSVLSNAFTSVVPGNIQPATDRVNILERRVGSLMTSLNDTIALHRFLRLRHRHIFTRHDRIRLRYVAGTAVCAAVGSVQHFQRHRRGRIQQAVWQSGRLLRGSESGGRRERRKLHCFVPGIARPFDGYPGPCFGRYAPRLAGNSKSAEERLSGH